ncbi:hypothetical protein MMC26_007006 [Xylographa opegraphella]|nr:hypothetical protein [Xylographa opegraphella]
MADMLSVDAATTNVTNANFGHEISLIDGIFGLQELHSVLSFPVYNGGIWTLSIQTSHLTVLLFTILVLTFAIDRYIFKSRYLVHIGGAKGGEIVAAALDEKAALYEKEAFKVESGQHCSNDDDPEPGPQPKHKSGHPASAIYLRLANKAMFITCILCVLGVARQRKQVAPGTDHEISEKSSMKTEAEWLTDIPHSTSTWHRIDDRQWLKATISTATLLLAIFGMLVVLIFHVLFWPAVLVLVILQQCAIYEYLNNNTAIPWQSIALRSTLRLVIWITIGVTLLVRRNKFQAMLWKCFKWTHAVTWWLFLAVVEFYSVGCVVATRYELQYDAKITRQVFVTVRPILIAYLCSGIVCDAVVAVRLRKLFSDY